MARQRRGATLSQGNAAKPKLRRGLGNRHHKNAADSAADAARKARRARVADLRMFQSLSWRDIAKEVGVDERTCRADYDLWLHDNGTSTNVEAVREEAETRLGRQEQEILLMRRLVISKSQEKRKDAEGNVVPAMSQPELLELSAALARLNREATRIGESRRKLHGADKPVRTELTGAGGGPVAVVGARSTLLEILELAEKNALEK